MSIAICTSAQRTLACPTRVTGRGLFFGKETTVNLKPGPPDSGFVFVRVDVDPPVEIAALAEHVAHRPRWTTLAAPGAPSVVVESVEHCLAGLAGSGVNNARIEIDSAELPAGDGSASQYAHAIQEVGLRDQSTATKPIAVHEPIVITDGDASIAALPTVGPLELRFELAYDAPAILKRQMFVFHPGEDDFVRELAPARTFALAHEARALVEQGLCVHLSPGDALVIGDDGPIKNHFRFPNEPARHKTLDLLGDLTLAGRPIIARIVASRSGHALNQRLAKALRGLAPPDNQVSDPTLRVGRSADYARPPASLPYGAGGQDSGVQGESQGGLDQEPHDQ